MKIKQSRKYMTISFYAFMVIAASLIFLFILLYPEKLVGGINKVLAILSPVIIGFIIAFLLNPIMKFFENTIFKKVLTQKKHRKIKRVISLICTYVIFIGAVSLFVVSVIPSITESVTDLVNNIQVYYTSGLELLEELLKKYSIDISLLDPFRDFGTTIIDYSVTAMKSILPKLYGVALSATSIVKNFIVGFFFSIYMLTSKETFKKQFVMILDIFTKEKTKNKVIEVAALTHDTFSRYISGYMVDSMIVGIVCYIVMMIFGWPYPALISLVIGVTNMIPFFGPFIGAVPSVFLILLKDPWQAIFFVIFIIILQQLDGNIIGPKVLGQRVGLSSFWVMIAIVVGGSLFGIPGMLISVPTLAVIYSLARSFVANKKEQKEKALKAEETQTETVSE